MNVKLYITTKKDKEFVDELEKLCRKYAEYSDYDSKANFYFEFTA